MESSVPLTLERSLGSIVKVILPVRVTFCVRVGLLHVLVIQNMDSCPERGSLLISISCWVFRDAHAAPCEEQEFFLGVAISPLYLFKAMK